MPSTHEQPGEMPRKKTGPPPEKNPFAEALGRRIGEAHMGAGYASAAAFHRALPVGLTGYDQLTKWIRGEVVPAVENLAVIAQVCHVSLDWLVLGAEVTPAAFVDWLNGPGRDAPEDAKRWLRSLPLHGHMASRAFYDLAFQAFKLGLSAEEAVASSRHTEDLRRSG